jgi:ribosomal protein S18 acetylase RimI-like enzyme
LIPIVSVEDIQKLIAKVRFYKKGYFTNFFLDVQKTELWIKLSLIEFEDYNETVFICRRNQGFENLYFITTNENALKKNLVSFMSEHKDELYVVDIVMNGSGISELRNILTTYGFCQYTSLVRMSRLINEPPEIFFDIASLHAADIMQGMEVNEMLQKYFDAFAEQLPLPDEIRTLAEKKQIVIYSENDATILGFLIFELLGLTSYLRYWFVHPDHRDKKIGSALLKYFFAQSLGTKRQIFWVIESNLNAIERYEHYGFRKENMFDYVMINRDITYEEENSKNIVRNPAGI